MTAPPGMNLGSGMDVPGMIKQLIEIERQPIQRMVRENERNQVMIKAWEEVRNRSMTLQDKSRQIYSFAGPFSRKLLESSEPGAVSGEASLSAGEVSEMIEVKRLASRHQIHSDPVLTTKDLPAGTFSVISEGKKRTYNFPGGSVSSLEKLISQDTEKNFSVFTVRSDAENSLIGFRSSKSGKDAALQFEDESGLLKSIGLIKEKTLEGKEIPLNPEDYIRKAESSGSYLLGNKEKSVSIKGQGEVALRDFRAENALLLFSGKTVKQEGESSSLYNLTEKQITEAVVPGPEIRASVGDVDLKGLNIERKRTREVNEAAPLPDSAEPGNSGSVTVYWKEGTEEKFKKIEYPAGTEKDSEYKEQIIDISKITGGNKAEKIVFASENGVHSEFRNLRIMENASGQSRVVPVHETEKAQDALLKINGVEITRPVNEGITDIIEGASLNLHKTTEGAVKVTVRADTEKIKALLKDWVAAHNNLLMFLKENSQTGDASDFKTRRQDSSNDDLAKGFEVLQDTHGVFAGDALVRRLITTLQSATGRSYPVVNADGFRILSDIGISTGAPGKNWDDIKNGYLEIDEAKLDSALSKAPYKVRDLFASDINSDARTDNGVAYTLVEDLAPYTRNAGGLVTLRIDTIKTKITDNKTKIDKMELSLKSKEQSLRQKFGRMERSMNESRAVGRSLQNSLRAAPGN